MPRKPKAKPSPYVRNKEELLKELRANAKFQEKMAFAKDVFFPKLVEATKSIDDASMFLSSINTVIMQDFLGRMKDVTIKDMKLTDKLDVKDEKYNELVELVSIFDDMSVFDAKELLEGMKAEISLFVQEELKERPLSDLKTKWLDQM